jgi:hypothetical protein
MGVVAFHINGTERTCRTKVLACTTSDTAFCIDNRYLQFFLASILNIYHLYGSGGAMTLAIATRLAVAHRNTVLPDPYCMAYLHGGFFLACNGTYGTCRTNVGTLGTFGTTISAFV